MCFACVACNAHSYRTHARTRRGCTRCRWSARRSAARRAHRPIRSTVRAATRTARATTGKTSVTRATSKSPGITITSSSCTYRRICIDPRKIGSPMRATLICFLLQVSASLCISHTLFVSLLNSVCSFLFYTSVTLSRVSREDFLGAAFAARPFLSLPCTFFFRIFHGDF